MSSGYGLSEKDVALLKLIGVVILVAMFTGGLFIGKSLVHEPVCINVAK